ncbi:DUF2779 domain-containing protein [Candidatus Saccharibacteria bacterium]|nr:DUF2779 domain-containing protein [Candidatus Saccharibacteria bacterium]
MLVLDKTNYINYRICPRYGWHRLNRGTQFNEDIKEQLYRQGMEVEILSRKLFPGGWEISGERQAAADRTEELIDSGEVKVLYQATALTRDGLLAKADITLIKKDRELHIYEVKMTNDVGLSPDSRDAESRKEKYLYDIAFQKLAFENAGYRVGKVFLIHMNGGYRLKTATVDPNKFFKQVDVGQEVEALLPAVKAEAEQAKACYGGEEPPCECHLKAKGKRCPGFEQFHPELANDDSVYNLNGIRVQRIKTLYERSILKIGEITEEVGVETGLSRKQLNQIAVHRTGRPIIDKPEIASMLNRLKPPLSFLDYEAINYPIPLFADSRPFQQIAFQFSLCVLENGEEEEPAKYEYLLPVASDEELKRLVDELRRVMPAGGSVVVWHQGAEVSFQNNLAELLPEEKTFFEDLNRRIFDLEKIFSGQHYVHPGFKGKTSLKNVAPVLAPELSYSDLNISEGSQASRMWDQALGEADEVRQKIFDDLLRYCHYDTLVMVRIYQHLKRLLARLRPPIC